jgi:hypothetical protein
VGGLVGLLRSPTRPNTFQIRDCATAAHCTYAPAAQALSLAVCCFLLRSTKKHHTANLFGVCNIRNPGCTQGLSERYCDKTTPQGAPILHASLANRHDMHAGACKLILDGYECFSATPKNIHTPPSAPSAWGDWHVRLRRTCQSPHANHLARGSVRFHPCARGACNGCSPLSTYPTRILPLSCIRYRVILLTRNRVGSIL